jgi:putative secretion ATPase (PEP-CTERM system associated)
MDLGMFEEFYGFSGRPFQLTPDPSFYYESLTHRKALSYLDYALAQGEGFVVITGEVGSGKSTLIGHLMASLDADRLTAAQVLSSRLAGDDLVHVVAQAFGLPFDGRDKALTLGTIEAFLTEEARAGRRCLLIVDEAQNLSIAALEELRMLSNFQLGAHPLLQTLLLGQPEFRATLLEHPDLDQLRQRVIATHHLGPIAADEARPYIEHRLACVGWEGDPSFDPQVFAKLCEVSGGVPRRINQLVNRLLLLGAVEKRSTIDAAMLEQVLAEMEEDGTINLLRPTPRSERVSPEPREDPRPADARATVDEAAIDDARRAVLEHMRSEIAERDSQIAELQQAVIELANSVEAPKPDQPDPSAAAIAELHERIAAMEGRMHEQDSTIRHTVTMLVEWLEEEAGRRAAA